MIKLVPYNSVILSNNNLTANIGGSSSIIADKLNNIGKYYLEISYIDGLYPVIGLSRKNGFYPVASIGYCNYDGGIYKDGSLFQIMQIYKTGDTIGLAINSINDTIAFYLNGIKQSTFNIENCKDLYPYVGTGASAYGPIVNVNFGTCAFDIVSKNIDAYTELIKDGYVPYDEENALWNWRVNDYKFSIKSNNSFLDIKSNYTHKTKNRNLNKLSDLKNLNKSTNILRLDNKIVKNNRIRNIKLI